MANPGFGLADIYTLIVLLKLSLNEVLVPSLGEVTLKDSSKEGRDNNNKPQSQTQTED
jgi:hypothetical protein